MIRVTRNAAGETLVLFRLSNAMTVAAMPLADGTATVAAWSGHTDTPTFGRMSVAGDAPVDADGCLAFLNHIAQIAGLADWGPTS